MMESCELKPDGLHVVCSYGIFRFFIEQAQEMRRVLNANARLLRPNKDWVNCPYEGHSDDCDCGGAGGDR